MKYAVTYKRHVVTCRLSYTSIWAWWCIYMYQCTSTPASCRLFMTRHINKCRRTSAFNQYAFLHSIKCILKCHPLRIDILSWPQCVERLGHGPYAVHDDVMKWKRFPCYWPFVGSIHRSPVNSSYKGRWRRALMFSLICTWINGWDNNREAGGFRRHPAHYDVTVM